MNNPAPDRFVAFEGTRLVAEGPLARVALACKHLADRGAHGPLLVLDATTSELRELDLRGGPADVMDRLAAAEAAARAAPPAGAAPHPPPPDGPRGRGRPRLGVVAREVTLLPRHWDWLASQPGGASVALRRLVEDARRTNAGEDAARLARDRAYRFMSALASGLPAFEEASRALFRRDRDGFADTVVDWPADVRRHALALAEPSFDSHPSETT